MQIQQTQDEIIFRISKTANIDFVIIQNIIDYTSFKEIASKSEASDEQILEIANEINSNWWEQNKSRFLQ